VTAVRQDSERRSDPRESRLPGEVGIWVFVLGDMTVFALFFATFMYSRHVNAARFAADHDSLFRPLGMLNTFLLLTSSLLVALGVTRVLTRRHGGAARLFRAGLACGLGFVIVKVLEWSRLFAEGHTVSTGEYFSYYFLFTGIHLGHVVIGLFILARLAVLTARPTLTEGQARSCEAGGIFWHMVDLLWVALFALFYLVR
jgi:nitric oxide reductase NorE protein